MDTPASRSLLIVPAPVSKRSFSPYISSKNEHELRFREGMHVPEPSMVSSIFEHIFFICSPLNKTWLQIILL